VDGIFISKEILSRMLSERRDFNRRSSFSFSKKTILDWEKNFIFLVNKFRQEKNVCLDMDVFFYA